MRFKMKRHPKLEFFALIGILSFLLLVFIVLAVLILPHAEEDFWFGFGFFTFSILWISIPLIITILKKADFFTEFTVNEQGITIHHPKKGEWTLFWNEIKDSGLVMISHRNPSTNKSFVRRFTYFSKNILDREQKQELKEKTEKDLFCMTTRDEVLWEVRKYYPLCLEVQNISFHK